VNTHIVFSVEAQHEVAFESDRRIASRIWPQRTLVIFIRQFGHKMGKSDNLEGLLGKIQKESSGWKVRFLMHSASDF
jgi:hypothetical protein